MLLPDATVETDGGTAPPDPQPPPDPPKVDPPPQPVIKPEPVPSDELVEQWAGADKALLASSMAAGVATQPDQQAKVVRLADQLGLPADAVKADYERLSRQVALRGADLTRVSEHHPELAAWLMVPENASIAHDDIPVLKQLDVVSKILSGQPIGDITGILPYGYMFMKNGTIRGPIVQGQAVVYQSLDELQKHMARQADIEATRAGAYDAEHAGDLFPNFGAALKARTASYISALRTIGGPTDEAQDIRRGAEDQLAEAAARDPSFMGAAVRMGGSLVPDLAAMAIGGEGLVAGKAIAGAAGGAESVLRANEILRFQRGLGLSLRGGSEAVTSIDSARNLSQALEAIAKGAQTLPAYPRSEYLADVFKNAAVFSPVAAASGINTGAENGTAYGVTDFLINAIGPAAAGRFGFAKAVLPGEETAAAAGGYLGVASRVLANATTQGGAMAATELANAMHEVATGVDPDALKSENLVPRLAQAGAMGAVMAGAFHLPGEIGAHVYRQHIAATAAIENADAHGAAIELLQASKANERVPDRVRDLAEKALGDHGRVVFLQDDDFLRISKTMGMDPKDLAAQLHVESEWAKAQTGKTMAVGTAELHQYLAKLGETKPEVVSATLMALRQRPDGMNAQEGLDFYQAAPKEIDQQIAAMRKDVEKAAKTVSEADPIYQDFLSKLVAVDRDPTMAKQEARIMSAFFHTKAARFNEEATAKGGALMDPLAEYQKYNLRVQTAEGIAPTTVEGLTRLEQPAYHGTGNPNPYERFDIGKVGGEGGEGTQNEGHGIYVTGSKGAGNFYREQNASMMSKAGLEHLRVYFKPGRIIKGYGGKDRVVSFHEGKDNDWSVTVIRSDDIKEYDRLGERADDLEKRAGDSQYLKDQAQQIRGQQRRLERTHMTLPEDKELNRVLAEDGVNPPVPEGRLYHVDIPDHGYLDFEKTIDQQEPAVRDRLFASGLLKRDAATGRIKMPNGEMIFPEQLTGDLIYDGITEGLLSKKAASEALYAAGIIGNRYRGDKKGEGAFGRYYNHVLFHDRDIKIAKYEQPSKSGPRGSLEFDAARHFLMTLTGRADPSTVSHEAAHFFLEASADFAARPDAPQQFKDDYAKMLHFMRGSPKERLDYDAAAKEWAGLSQEERTKRHEIWARSIEQYLMEGHAPSPELRPIFHRFLFWLTDLYKKVQKLVSLTPEVRQVMDRMLATDEAINRAREETGVSQTFKDRESSGMSEAAWESYLRLTRRDRELQQSNVFAQAMKVLRRERTQTYKREYAGVKAEAAAFINDRPISKAEDALVHGIDADGKDLPAKPKLARSQIVELRGEEFVRTLPRGTTGSGAGEYIWNLARAAEEFGFSDSEAMLDALTAIPDRKKSIRDMADAMMKARYPELTPEAMLEEALKAVHANDSQGDVLGRESAALAIKAGRTAIPQQEIRRIAENEIAGTPMEDVKPKLYLRAEKKNGDDCTAELLKESPDYTKAHNLKQAQELAHACYRAAQEAEAVIAKTDDLMKTVRRTKTQQMLGKAGGQGWSVVNPDGSVMPMGDQASAVKAASENGGTAQVGIGYQVAMRNMHDLWENPAHLEMPYGQVLDFYRQAATTMHQAREATSILTEAKQEALDRAVAEGIRVEDTDKNGGKKPPVPPAPLSRNKGDAFKRGLGRGLGTMRALSFVARQMDGERDGGWHWEHFAKPLNEASDNQQIRQHANAVAMDAVYKAYGKTNFLDHRVMVPEVGERLSLETRLSVALNSGSTKNLRRLADGRGLDRTKVQAIINTLDQKDWEFVKAVWGVVNRDWEETKALHQKIDGIAPEKRDSLIVSTPFGNIQGHYYPIIYDTNRSARGIEIEQRRNRATTRPEPSHSFTHQTVERTELPLLLTLDGIHRHLNDTAHWLSHAETIANLNKLLNDDKLSSNMIARFGEPAYNVLRDTVNYVAIGTQGPHNWWDKVVRWIRTRSGTATMGFNTMSALSQPFGMTQSMERVGTVRYLKAQAEFAMSPIETGDRVRAMSTMMQHRGESLIVETAEQQGAGRIKGLHDWIQRKGAYWMMNKMQWTVDVPTWLAGYERAKEQFPDEEAKCRAQADQDVIDTQGSGLAKDLSDVQRHEMTRMLTQFGGFFLRTYNLLYNRAAADAKLKGGWLPSPNDGEALGRIMSTMLLTVSLPAVAMSLFRQGMKPDSKEENTAAWWAKRLGKDQLSYLLSTVIFGRELTGAIDGFDYSGPAGMRSVALSSQLLKQLFQGKADHGLERAAVQTIGTFTGLPGTQAQRVIDALLYYSSHPTLDPRPLIAGPPR